MSQQNYFVYIVTNQRHTVLYIGVTNDLERRLNEHSLGRGSQFVQQYNATKLIYFEAYSDAESAITREKQLKNWSRKKKEFLITRSNPEWRDLILEMHAVRAAGASR
jgi:putative endonuclease